MKASVVVLNYNSGDQILRSVDHLLAQDFAGEYEIVVIENASTDGGREKIRARFGDQARVRIIESDRNRGCAGGRNLGLETARGELVCFVDADAFAEPEWLSEIVAAFGDPAVGVVASTSVLDRNPLLLNGLGGTLNLQGYGWDQAFGEPRDLTDLPREALFACGNGLCVRRRLRDRIGGFDDLYVNYYEDVDFCLRARRAGFRLAVAPKAVLRHALGAADAVNPNRSFLLERNRIRTVLRNFPLGLILRWLPRELWLEARAYRWRPRGTFRRAWAWNLRNLGSLRRSRFAAGGALPPLPAGELRPWWGFGRFKLHNLAFRPDPATWRRAFDMADGPDGALLYGWYERARTPGGVSFRWSDGLSAVALRSESPIRSLELDYFWCHEARPGTSAALYVRHLGTGAVFAGSLGWAPAFVPTKAVAALDLPPGEVQVVLHTPEPVLGKWPLWVARGPALSRVAIGPTGS